MRDVLLHGKAGAAQRPATLTEQLFLPQGRNEGELVFGAGGTMIELIADRAMELPPLNQFLARRLVERARVSEALTEGADAEAEGASELNEQTQWHQVVVWGKQGENCAQFLRKGHGVYLEGSIRIDERAPLPPRASTDRSPYLE